MNWFIMTASDIGKKMVDSPLLSSLYSIALMIFGFMYGAGDIVKAGITVVVLLVTIDWLAGTSAARRDGIDTSQYGIEGVKRSLVIMLIPSVAHFLDTFLYTQGLASYFSIAALCRSITKSIVANLYRAGWTSWIPVSLLDTLVTWVEDEIIQKETRSAQRREEIGRNDNGEEHQRNRSQRP